MARFKCSWTSLCGSRKRFNLAIKNMERFKCSWTATSGSCQRFNLAIEDMVRFKYEQDGWAHSKIGKNQRIFSREIIKRVFFHNFQETLEGRGSFRVFMHVLSAHGAHPAFLPIDNFSIPRAKTRLNYYADNDNYLSSGELLFKMRQ